MQVEVTAYFGEARSIFWVEDLVSLAGEIGPGPEDAREALLPHRFGVAGAQPVDTLLSVLQRAWDERLVPDPRG